MFYLQEKIAAVRSLTPLLHPGLIASLDNLLAAVTWLSRLA